MPQIAPDDAGGSAVTRFLDLIAFSEGTDVLLDRGYGAIVSGVDGHHTFTDYSTHPFTKIGMKPIQVRITPPLFSTASGRYQLLLRWWFPYQQQLHLPDFSPRSQDLIAIQQMREHHAVAMVQAGDIQGAITACSKVWASMPGNDYQQGGKSMQTLLNHYALASLNNLR